MSSNAKFQAQELLLECGFDEITDIPIDLFTSGLGATLIEEPLSNCDGKIIFGQSKTLIKVNSQIQFEQRKRFVIAHEIGHMRMHKGMKLPDDTFASFNIIAGTEKHLKNGKQEVEANEFASELLMPTSLFLKEATGKKFSPTLIKKLSDRFKTSLTATVFKYLQSDLHPIALVFIENGMVKYWLKSEKLVAWFEDYNRLPPPTDSVANEYLKSDYAFLYSLDAKAQPIFRSTWFRLGQYDIDSKFYEYCIPSRNYKSILSIIWED